MQVTITQAEPRYNLTDLTEDEAGALFGVLVNLSDRTPQGPDHNEATKEVYQALSDALPASVKDKWMAHGIAGLRWVVVS